MLFNFNIFPVSILLEAVNEDALAFAIAPNTSVCDPGLRKHSHSTEPFLAPVFLSPPPLSSPSQLMSLATVLLSYSSSLSEISDNFGNNGSPSCPDEASFAVVHNVIFLVVLTTFIVFVARGFVFC